MSFLDRMRKRAEIGPTDRAVAALREAVPAVDVTAVYVPCREGHLHYGVLVESAQDAEALVLVRCHPWWYVVVIGEGEADRVRSGFDEATGAAWALLHAFEYQEAFSATMHPKAMAAAMAQQLARFTEQ